MFRGESNISSIIDEAHVDFVNFPCQLKYPNAFVRVVLVGIALDGEDGVVVDFCDYAGMPLAAAMVDDEDGAGFDVNRWHKFLIVADALLCKETCASEDAMALCLCPVCEAVGRTR